MNGQPTSEILRFLSKLPPVEQMILIFLLGGSVVLIATIAGKVTQNPYVAGILICFPAMLLSGTLAFHFTGASPDFVSEFLLGTVPGLAIAAGFAIVGHFTMKNLDFWPALLLALLGWLVLAAAGVVLRLHS